MPAIAAMREPAALVFKRDEAIPETASEVVVAAVPVALTKVKFCKVEEPTTNKSPEELMVEVAEPPILSWLAVSCPEKREVEVAEVVVDLAANRLVVEAVPFTSSKKLGFAVPMPTLPPALHTLVPSVVQFPVVDPPITFPAQ